MKEVTSNKLTPLLYSKTYLEQQLVVKKKVIHIITGLNDGGAEGVLFRLCRYSQFSNIKHTVISLTGGGKYRQPLSDCGIKVYSLKMKSFRNFFSGAVELYRILKKEKPDIVQTWMYHADLIGGVIAKLARIKKIIWGIRHSDFGKEIKVSTKAFIFLSSKLSYYIPDIIVSCATSAQKFHIDYGYCPKKFQTIHNGYDVTQYYPDSTIREQTRAKWGIKKDHLVLGTVARYNEQKGHSILLEALSILAKRNITFTCLLVGKGCNKENSALVKMIHFFALKKYIKLLGQQNAIINTMNAIDIHILPSVSGEGFPNVVAEAMCCGVPCIATDVGDAAEITSTHGLIVPKNNPLALADAIEEFAKEKDTPQWQKRKTQSREFIIDNFTINKMVTRFNELY